MASSALVLPTSKPTPDALFIYQQEPPQEWNLSLLRAVPRRPGARWFKVLWEPGF